MKVTSSIIAYYILLYTNKSNAFTTKIIKQTLTFTSSSKAASFCLNAKSKKVKVEDEEQSQKKAALEGVLQQIERNYGMGSILKLGDADNMAIDRISSGSLTLDGILGGGYPKGRIIEIYGPESSGKTTLALHAVASVQKAGGIAAFVDAEHALDPEYAARIGVDTDNLFVSQPDSGEMALDIVDRLVRSSAVEVIVVDSVAALVPRAELEGDMSDSQIGLQARLMSKAMRKIVGSLAASQCTVIFLNQLRSKVGVIYGSPEVTSGGNALKFYASVRLDTRRKEILPESSGIKIKVKTVKNKTHPPFQMVELDVLFGTGIDYYGSLFDAALDVGCITRKGSWYSYNDTNFSQGRGNGIVYMKENPEFTQMLEKETIRLTALAQSGIEQNNVQEDDSEDEEEYDEEEENELLLDTSTKQETVLE